MVVFVIDIDGLAPVDPECDAPVLRDGDRPSAGAVAGHQVQPVARQVHAVWEAGAVEAGQDAVQLVGKSRRNAARIIPLEQKPQPLMPDVSDHGRLYRVAIQATSTIGAIFLRSRRRSIAF